MRLILQALLLVGFQNDVHHSQSNTASSPQVALSLACACAVLGPWGGSSSTPEETHADSGGEHGRRTRDLVTARCRRSTSSAPAFKADVTLRSSLAVSLSLHISGAENQVNSGGRSHYLFGEIVVTNQEIGS